MLNKMLTTAFYFLHEVNLVLVQSQAWAVIAMLAKTGFQLAQQNLGKEPLRTVCITLTNLRENLKRENAYPEPISGSPNGAHVNCTINIEINRLHFCSTTGGMHR